MLVDLKTTANFKKGDIPIADSNNVFNKISKEDLLKDMNKRIKDLEDEVELLKSFLKTYQIQVTTLLKGVIDNG